MLREYVYSWYGVISYDEEFPQELRQTVRYSSAVLLRRLSKVDLTTLITRKAIPIGLSHLDSYLLAKDLSKVTKIDVASKRACMELAARKTQIFFIIFRLVLRPYRT